MVKGARYYIESLHKESTGADHLAVGWKIPGSSSVSVISGNFLSPLTTNFTASRLAFNETGLITNQSQLNSNSKDSNRPIVTAYPNPAPTQTTMSFTLPESHSLVILDIYDLNGNKIQQVYKGKAEGGKTYNFEVNTSALNGLVYNARLVAGKEVYNFKLLKN